MPVVNEARQEQSIERYSFSKLSSWWVCPYGYYQRYIEHKAGIGNAFASFGTLVHELLEKYAKGEAELWDLPQMYEWMFDAAVPEKFPYNRYTNLKKSYYEQGLSFLKRFQGYENVEILGVEEEFTVDIDDWQLTGFIDICFRDENGKLIIRDYKSKASFKNDAERHQYARQLYLYSIYVHQKYGVYPDELQFLMFRKKDEPVRIEFNMDDFNEAVQWAKDTVQIIRGAIDYPAQCEDFYASNLCNHREYCLLKPKNKHKKKK